MPYRHAYLWVLLLFPAVGLAFWPSYFARLGQVSWVLHAHGVTASAWIALLALQSWSIQYSRRPLHKFAGRASLVLFPLFWTSGLLIVHLMAAGFVAHDNPFHSTFGARLVPVDAITSASVLYLYYLALSRRREVLVHAAAMLAIPLFLLAPIFGRIVQIGGPLAIHSLSEFYKFGYGLELCNLAAVLIGLYLYSRRPRTAWPFLVPAGGMALQSLMFETIGRTRAWETAMASIGVIPTGGIALGGLVIGSAVVWYGWTRPASSGPPTRGKVAAMPA